MFLIRCIFFAPLAAILLAGCDGLDRNESTLEQSDPGDVRMVVNVTTRFRSRNALTGNTDSEDVDILATEVFASLSYGSGDNATAIELLEGDDFTAATASAEAELEPVVQQGTTFYRTVFFEPALTSETMRASLQRSSSPPATWFPSKDSPEPDFSDYHVDAESTIELPPEIYIESPPTEDAERENHLAVNYSNDAEVTVTWTPYNVWTPDNVNKPDRNADDGDDDGIDSAHTLEFETNCNYPPAPGDVDVPEEPVSGWFEIENDPGTFTVNLDDFFEDPQDETDPATAYPDLGPCDIEFEIVRHATGAIDSQLAENSRINALIRSETVHIFTCPSDQTPCPAEEDL